MKKLAFLFISLLFTANSFGQAVVLLEDFDSAPQYILPEMPEQIVGTSDYFTRTDGSDISAEIIGADGNFFAAQDIDAGAMVSPATMVFDDLDISTYTNLTFGVVLAEDDSSDGKEDWDDSDSVHFDYQIDNSGTWIPMVWIEKEATATEFNGLPRVDTDFDGIGDGTAITNSFDHENDIEFNIPDTGSLIDIRVTFNGLTSGDEDIAIAEIYLVDNLNLFPDLDLTAPTEAQVFPGGTTSVDVEYAITNTAERVDIIINGTTTSDIGASGTYAVPTVDGEAYSVEVLIFIDDIDVDSRSVSFSVDSALAVKENELDRFSVYPNPTSLGYVNINSKNIGSFEVIVFDILGKLVVNTIVTNNKLDVSNLESGLYIMKLKQDNATVTKRLVIR